jgi:glycosyltransferase involved in cell wall biosynthesis
MRGSSSSKAVAGARIAFVEFPPSGGLFQFSVQLAEALARLGHDVQLYTGPQPELLSSHPGFSIRPVLPTWHPGDRTSIPPALRKIRRGVRAVQLAVAWVLLLAHLVCARPHVVLWSNWPFSIDAIGVLAVRRALPRTLLGKVAHEPRLVRRGSTTLKRGLLLDRALPAAWQSLDVVFVLGERAREQVLETWRPRGPVVVIPHGDERALRAGRPIPPVADAPPTVLFFGTWSPYKGVDVLLDCWPEVLRHVPAARLVLAGSPADADLNALLGRVDALERVDARPGYVPTDQVAQLFAAARVVVVPYLRASQSGVVHLAYTFERPVVATAVGDIPAVVRDGETGVLVPPGEPTALADGLVRLLTDGELAERCARAGARYLAAHSSWQRVAIDVNRGLEIAGIAGAVSESTAARCVGGGRG